MTVHCKIESFVTHLPKVQGVETPSVRAEVSGDYIGTVFHLGGATTLPDGTLVANPLWNIDRRMALTLEGRVNVKTGNVGAVVREIAEVEATAAPLPEIKSTPVTTNVPPPVVELAVVQPVQPKPKPTTKMASSRLKAKAPELVKPGKIKAVIYGISGVGKTTLALSFPAPYYYDVEGGAKGPQYRKLLADSGGVYMGPEDGTLSFDTLIDQMQALATEKHQYKTLIVDSLTKLFQTTIAAEQERLGDKDAFGASKKPAVAAMRRMIMWASRLDMNIWFVCHEAAEWGLDRTGQRTEIGRIPDCWDKLIYELDLAIQVVKRGPQRVAIVKKSRIMAFPDADSFNLDYAEFAARIGKDVIESEAGTVTLAMPDQVAEIKKLLEIVRIPDEDIQKGFDKFGVAKWEEMTTEQAATWQSFLKKKISA
jgi:hypothetical protein